MSIIADEGGRIVLALLWVLQIQEAMVKSMVEARSTCVSAWLLVGSISYLRELSAIQQVFPECLSCAECSRWWTHVCKQQRPKALSSWRYGLLWVGYPIV